MRRILPILISLLILAVSADMLKAQSLDSNSKGWQERLKSEKIAFLTDAMELTPSEAERFWPVYNKAEKERNESFRVALESYFALKNAVDNGKGEKEVSALLDKYIQSQKASNGIDEKYVDLYKKIISGEKVAKLYIAEEEFRRQQIHRLNRPNPNVKRK